MSGQATPPAAPPAAPAATPPPAMVVTQAPPAAPSKTPPSQQTAKEGNASRRSAVEGIFSQPAGPTPPVETPTPPPAPPPAAEPPKAVEPPKPVEPPKTGLEFSEDIDFNIDEKPKPVVEPVVPTEEPPPADESQSVKTLREQLQIQGRRAKDFEAEVQEKTIEMDRLRAENTRLQAELQSPKRVAADPFSHPQIAADKDALLKNRDAFSLTLPSDRRAAFAGEFENMLGMYAQIANDRNPETQNKLIDELQEKIGRTAGDSMVTGVMQLLAANGDRYTSLIDKIRNFSDLAEEMTITESVENWTKQSGKVGALVSTINGLDDEVIEADPHTPAAYVAKLVKSDPAYAARSEQVKQVITEAFFGRRPLTKEELKGLAEAKELDGISVDDFIKAREKRVGKSRDEAVRRLYVAMMMAPDLPEMIKTTVKQKQEKSAAETERLALITSTTPRKTEPKSDEPPKRAVEEKSAIYKVLDKF